MWKCLTAVKVCEELAVRGFSAVPVCWINANPPEKFSQHSVRLLDPESELHELELPIDNPLNFSPEATLSPIQVSGLFSQIENLGRGSFDDEILDILRSRFDSDTTCSSAVTRMIAGVVEEWGMIVLDANAPALKPKMAGAFARVRSQAGTTESILKKTAEELASAGYVGKATISAVHADLVQSLVLPVAVRVVDPGEVFLYASSLPVFNGMGLPEPLAWPQSSITVLDARSRRILERYGLDIHQLYEGENETIRRIIGDSSDIASRRLDNLMSEVASVMDELNVLEPMESKFLGSVHTCREKIIYQLEKLRKYCADAGARKKDAVNRQIHKVCNFLAPDGSIQERELAGIFFPLRYSLAGLRSLYEKVDIFKLDHQLISVD